MVPWPGAYTIWQGDVLKINRAHAIPGEAVPGKPAVQQGLPALGCAGGWLVLDEVHPAGKKALNYILGRGISRESLALFKLGFAPILYVLAYEHFGRQQGGAKAAAGKSQPDLFE